MSRLKFSKLEHLLNWLMFGLCCFMILLCVLFAFLGRSWSLMMLGKADYLELIPDNETPLNERSAAL